MAITEVSRMKHSVANNEEGAASLQKKEFLISCVFMTGTADNAQSLRAHHILHMWNINSRHSYAMYVVSPRSCGMSQVQVTQESTLWTAYDSEHE